MNEEQKERFFDLLTAKAIYGLDEESQRELDEFDKYRVDMELRSLEVTAASIGLIGVDADEQMPEHLFAKIAEEAGKHVVVEAGAAAPWPPPDKKAAAEKETGGTPWFAWLGWAVAAAACIALAVNIFVMRPSAPEIAKVQPTPVSTPKPQSPAEMREEMLRTESEMVRANWALGNVKGIREITGDVVWSDEKQTGYMRFRGLPINDKATEQYQLWIFDKTQDKATPIDGGTFDVTAEGEVVIPITAKLKARSPEMFAVTIEKPGGVVVSSREKIAALAKVETRSS